MAERCPITGTSLYLVLKSNDLPRPKIRLKKFGFSPIDTPANIAKKLPPQRCFKPLLIALFNFSHKRPTFASQAKVGTHSAFGEKSHTTAYTPKQGRFGRGWYHYPRIVSHVSETLRGQGVERQTLPLLGLGRGYSRRTQRAFGTAMRLCVSLSRGVAAPLGCAVLLLLSVQCDLPVWKDLTKRSGRVTITRNNRTTSRLALVWKPRWAVK